MRFFTPLLALAGLLTLCVIAAPIANANLAIPVHGAATYETDLAAAVAYARSAGVAPVADMSPTANGATNFGKQCGTYSIVAGGFLFPTYTTDYYCNETEQAEEMKYFYNHWCGFCVVFDGRQCQGAVRWNGGPNEASMHDKHDVKGAKSYFCLA